MEYLPILLRIPEEQYEILITLQSDSLFVYHTVVINKILFERKPSKKPTWATTEVFRATITNTVMEAKRLKYEGCTITQAFKDSLILLFGDSAEITVENKTENQFGPGSYAYHKARQSGKSAFFGQRYGFRPGEFSQEMPEDDLIASMKMAFEAQRKKAQDDLDEQMAEEIRRRQRRQNGYGNRNQG